MDFTVIVFVGHFTLLGKSYNDFRPFCNSPYAPYPHCFTKWQGAAGLCVNRAAPCLSPERVEVDALSLSQQC